MCRSSVFCSTRGYHVVPSRTAGAHCSTWTSSHHHTAADAFSAHLKMPDGCGLPEDYSWMEMYQLCSLDFSSNWILLPAKKNKTM